MCNDVITEDTHPTTEVPAYVRLVSAQKIIWKLALMMEAVSFSKTSVNIYKLHGATSQKFGGC
jgi:hypothetical protein